MVLNEDNYIEIINSYSKDDWKPLFDLIPKIEKTTVFGETKDDKYSEEGTIRMYATSESQVVSSFRKIVYDIPIIIDFNWGGWDEGRKIVSDNNFNYNSIDIPTKCKIITAYVRNDRFCDGALAAAFESGIIPKILKSVNSQINIG